MLLLDRRLVYWWLASSIVFVVCYWIEDPIANWNTKIFAAFALWAVEIIRRVKSVSELMAINSATVLVSGLLCPLMLQFVASRGGSIAAVFTNEDEELRPNVWVGYVLGTIIIALAEAIMILFGIEIPHPFLLSLCTCGWLLGLSTVLLVLNILYSLFS